MQTIRVAAGQGDFSCAVAGEVGAAHTANAAVAAQLVREAGHQGVRLLVLPEAALSGYCPLAFTAPSLEAEVFRALASLREAAVAQGVDVLISTPVVREHGTTLSLAWVRSSGEVSLVYDKQHLSGELERTHFVPGSHGTSIDVDGWGVALSICYDGSFPEHARAAADDGALLYVNSGAFFVGGEHRRDLYYAARALDNGMYSLFAGATGECSHAESASVFAGGSAVYDPEGRALVRLGREPGLAVADLDVEVVRATREAHPMLAERVASLGERQR